MLIKLGWQGPVRKGEKEKEERRKRRVSRERERERKGRGSIVSSAHACRRRECTARYRPRIRSCTTEYVYMCMYILCNWSNREEPDEIGTVQSLEMMVELCV